MASEQPESVIARLMGFNEPPPNKEQFYKRCRVLSDWYIERAASVGAHQGNRLLSRRSYSLHAKSSPAAKALPVVSKNKYDITLQNSSRSTALEASMRSQTNGGVIVPELSVPCYKGKSGHLKNESDLKPIHILSHLQRPKYDTPVARIQLHDVEKPGKHLTVSSAFEPDSVKAANGFDDIKLDLHSKALSGGKIHHRLDYRNPGVSNIPSMNCSHITRNGTSIRNFQQQKTTSNPQAVFGSVYLGECYSINKPEGWVPSSPRVHSYYDYIHARHVCPMKSPMTIESVNRNLEKWKIPKEDDHVKGFVRGQSIDETPVSANRNSVVRSLNSRSGRIGRNLKLDLFSRRDKSKKQNILQEDSVESTDGRGHMQLQLSPGMNDVRSQIMRVPDSTKSYFSSGVSDYSNPETCGKGNPCEMDVSKSSTNDPPSRCPVFEKLDSTEAASIVCSGISAELQSKSTPGALSMEEKHSSHLESFSEEVLSLNELSEKDFSDSCCSRSSPREFQDYLKGNNQRSPGSVLESFEQHRPNFSECLESLDMLLLLQSLDIESDESYSDGSVMVVSGDEDSVEGFSDLHCDKKNIYKWSDESRNFFYLVDVLEEAGLCSMKSFMDLKDRDDMECPINYMVIESLEKKYGKQTSLPMSERRLLFDRINAGLMDIINPVTNTNGCGTSTRECCSEARKYANIEDALWLMLINEEKEKNWDLSMKALGKAGKWMELEEDISIICRELECLLFEELVMEFISLLD